VPYIAVTLRKTVDGREVIVVRPGEYTVKSRGTRRWFDRLLARNLGEALRSEGYTGEVRREWGRLYVYAERDAVEALRRVFGVRSLSPALEVEYSGLEDLLVKAEKYFADKVAGRVFAVRARRSWAEGFTSLDVERLLGARLAGYARGVDLEEPEVTAYVEVRGRRAYFYTEVIPGYGGLPIGSEGRALALFSGGHDSPVAAWYIMRRGAKVDLVFFNVGGEAYLRAVFPVAKVLGSKWSYGYRQRLYVVPFSSAMRVIAERVKPSLVHIVFKRLIYRGAEVLAERVGAEALVTGESLGQVSSQTMRNLRVTDEAVRLPVFRPLIGLDKEDIVAVAREIGTYRYSSLVKEYCGAFSVRPATHADPEAVAREEAKLPGRLLDDALEQVEVVDVRGIELEGGIGDLEVDYPPPGSVIVDLRPREKYSRRSIPGSIHMDFHSIFAGEGSLDPSKTYVFVCDEGALSREAALYLRRKGFRAYSLRGGIRKALRRLGEGGRRSPT